MKKVIGFTDSVTTCECCGKKDLKGTFCLEIDGVELYYGSTCAVKYGHSLEDQKKDKATFVKIKNITRIVAEANCEYLQDKAYIFAEKKGFDMNVFMTKYGNRTSTSIINGGVYSVYEYGSRCKQVRIIPAIHR